MPKKTHNESKHWAEQAAEQVLSEFPNESVYIGASGISPSGTVHFGNLRDLTTAYAVLAALADAGKKVRLIFYWDDYDRFRKVPEGVDSGFAEHIGTPLSAVPDPFETPRRYRSYAERFEKQFESETKHLYGLDIEFKYQTAEYARGVYDQWMIQALQRREIIANVLLSFMSDKAKQAKGIKPEKYRADYYPVAIYSRFTGKDTTKVLEYDDTKRTLHYYCTETKQEDTVTIGQDRNLKLAWKVDWAMRWAHEQVAFEPAGADHAAPGSSFDVGTEIVTKVFDARPPVFQAYGMVGLHGISGKMSGSAGSGISPGTLLDVYEQPIVQWLYLRKNPRQNFSLSFDSEVLRQYDEFDREVAAYSRGALDRAREFSLKKSFWVEKEQRYHHPIPFRQAVAFGQIVQWDARKLGQLLTGMKLKYDAKSIESRLERARNWLEQYNPDQMIALLEKPNERYAKQLSAEARQCIAVLRKELAKPKQSIEALEKLVYAIPKDPDRSQEENSPRQRAFFKDVYNLLLGRDTGPRLSTFLWALDRRQVLQLLDVKRPGGR